MTTLKFIPPRVQLCDPRTGFINREWYLFFQGVFDRIGGATGESTTDLNTSMFEDAGIEELKSGFYSSVQDALQAVLVLQDQVAELVKEIETLKGTPRSEPAVGANPSATVGLAVVNGSASTFMRSDAAPALDLSIAPTWTGAHTFQPSSGHTTIIEDAAFRTQPVNETSFSGLRISNTAASRRLELLYLGTNQGGAYGASQGTAVINAGGTGGLTISANDAASIKIDSSQNVGIKLTPSGSYALEVNGALSVSSTTMLRSATSFTNGAGAGAGTLTNAPAAGNPTKWVPINDAGVTRYIPCW